MSILSNPESCHKDTIPCLAMIRDYRGHYYGSLLYVLCSRVYDHKKKDDSILY